MKKLLSHEMNGIIGIFVLGFTIAIVALFVGYVEEVTGIDTGLGDALQMIFLGAVLVSGLGGFIGILRVIDELCGGGRSA